MLRADGGKYEQLLVEMSGKKLGKCLDCIRGIFDTEKKL